MTSSFSSIAGVMKPTGNAANVDLARAVRPLHASTVASMRRGDASPARPTDRDGRASRRCVPRLRVWRWPTCRIASCISGQRALHHVGELDLALARHGADLERAARLADVGRALDPLRSMMWSGCTNRMLSIGISDCPPARSLALSSVPRRPTASLTRARIVVAEGRWFHARTGEKSSLYIAGKPCLNPKNNNSPKYGMARGRCPRLL